MCCFIIWIVRIAFREDKDELRKTFPPLSNARVPMGDVFTSCNWVIRDGWANWNNFENFLHLVSAPKTASKRIFLITDEDNPHPSAGSKQLITSARTTLIVCPAFCLFPLKPDNPPRISHKQVLRSNPSLSLRKRNPSSYPNSTLWVLFNFYLLSMKSHSPVGSPTH